MKPVSLAHGEVTVSRAGPRQVNEMLKLLPNWITLRAGGARGRYGFSG